MLMSQLSKLVNIICNFDIPYFSTKPDPSSITINKIKGIKNAENNSESLSSSSSRICNTNNKEDDSCILSTSELDEVELTMSNIMDTYIEKNPIGVSSPYFEDDLEDYVISNVLVGLKEFYEESALQEILHSTYTRLSKLYFSKYYPRRSYDNTFIRKIPNKQKIQEKIAYIENKPQPEQKSNEWYMFRHNLITASSAWKVFKSQSTINQLIVEKCKTLDLLKYDSVNTGTPMHHGNKYEDVSIMFYEHKYKTKVRDYGCIQHDTYSFLGASPDGINVDPSSDRYGRMLEIKNPTTREITGIPKEDYWIQMQLQMETCNLHECDFLETSFKEYEDEEAFINDGTFTYSNNDELKGIIVYFMKQGKPLYEYMPLYISKHAYEIWYDNIMETHSDLTWITNIYWRLEEYSCILVLRNREWFKHAIPYIERVWKLIETEKITGCQHRMPKRINRSRAKPNYVNQSMEFSSGFGPGSSSDASSNIPIKNTCMINIDNLKTQITYIDTGYEVDDPIV